MFKRFILSNQQCKTMFCSLSLKTKKTSKCFYLWCWNNDIWPFLLRKLCEWFIHYQIHFYFFSLIVQNNRLSRSTQSTVGLLCPDEEDSHIRALTCSTGQDVGGHTHARMQISQVPVPLILSQTHASSYYTHLWIVVLSQWHTRSVIM